MSCKALQKNDKVVEMPQHSVFENSLMMDLEFGYEYDMIWVITLEMLARSQFINKAYFFVCVWPY